MLKISKEIAARFPGVTIGIVQGECAKNAFADENAYLQQARAAEEETRKIANLAEQPNVAAWRKMYRAFSEDPTKRKPSAEALAKRVLNGEQLPRVNALVDCYNLVSLRNLIPVGGQDREKIVGQMVLRFAREGESFTPLGAKEIQQANEGEVVYADAEKILCRKWNYRDCEEAKIAETTAKFVLVVDGAAGIPAEKVEGAANELKAALEKFIQGCSANTSFART